MSQFFPLDRIRIVLMETSHPGNIGAVARAMKNMGMSRLCLVNPRHFPADEAKARAAGAGDILEQARVVASLDEALADCTLVFGASARDRKLTWPVVNPREGARRIVDMAQTSEVAILFGREDSGLSNDELQRCHFHIHIPSDPGFSSLNLGMAVQVIAYEVRMDVLSRLENQAQRSHIRSITSPEDAGWKDPLATVDDVEGFLAHLEQTMVHLGFHDPENPRQLMMRLRRLYQRIQLDRREVNMLRGILKETLLQCRPVGQVKADEPFSTDK